MFRLEVARRRSTIFGHSQGSRLATARTTPTQPNVALIHAALREIVHVLEGSKTRFRKENGYLLFGLGGPHLQFNETVVPPTAVHTVERAEDEVLPPPESCSFKNHSAFTI